MSRTSLPAIQSGWSRLLLWDETLLVAACGRSQTAWLRRGMRGLTRAGDTGGWLVHGLVLGLFMPEPLAYVQLLVIAAALATLVSQALKRLCRRTRPDRAIAAFTAGAANPDVFSFPSGHTSVAFAVATALAGANGLLGTLELSMAAAIACSRVGLGAHYPLDVIAGIGVGVSCGFGAGLIAGLL
ncbi:MAG TPA: phosphatase PAP2 family protein [Candidatus Binatia bacterium]|nr:phosphatase PAP2 family protein [Candidatus Binatia bacterium]